MRHWIYGLLDDGTPFTATTDSLPDFLAATPTDPAVVYIPNDETQSAYEPRESPANVYRGQMTVLIITPGEEVDIDDANAYLQDARKQRKRS